MTPEQFVYWLQGYAELGAPPPSAEQWEMIREHLGTVFMKVTPPLQPEKVKDVPTGPFPPLNPWKPRPMQPMEWPPTGPFCIKKDKACEPLTVIC